MAPPPSDRVLRRTSRASRVTWTLVLAVTMVFLLDGLPTAAGAASPSPVALATTSATPSSDPLQSAEASLSAGHGPAAGLGVTCSGGATVSCYLPNAAPRPSASSSSVWTDLSAKLSTNPPARYLGSMVYDPVDHYVVLFGGSNGVPMSDTWTYANGQWTQLSPSSSPSQRYIAMATWDGADNYLLLFGGYDSSTGLTNNETWTFVGGQWTELSPANLPPTRWRGAMAYDAGDGYVVLFGGTATAASTTGQSDTWEFVGGVWTNVTTTVTGSPPGRYRAEMTYDSADGYILLFGGCTSSTCNPTSQDTWTFSAGAWTKLTPTTKPGGRAYEGLTYDALDGYVLMFGGENYATTSGYTDTWEFHGGNWTDLTSGLTTHPSTRAFEMIAYDALDGYTVLFGGQNPAGGSFFSDTWAYGPSVIASFSTARPVIDLGQTTTLNATPFAFSGYVNTSYSGLPPGCSTGNVSLLNCTPTMTGQFVISATLNDSTGAGVTKSLTLTVNPDPQIAATQLPRAVVTQGSRIWLNVTATNGTPPYGYGYSGLPSGCSSANTANFTCLPSSAGSYRIRVAVTDSLAFTVFTNVTLTVNPLPTITSFVAVPSTIDLGESVTLYANATGGTAPLSYSYASLPPGCAPANTPVLVCTPTAVGLAVVGVNATDAFGWRAAGAVSFTVNTPPTVLSFNAAPLSIDIGQTITLWFNTTGGTGTLALSYSGLPPGCNIGVAATGTCTPTQNGSYTVSARATDARGISAVASLTLTIVDDPSVQTVDVHPSALDVGQNVTITVVYSGGTAPFQFSYTGLPVGCTGTQTAVVLCKPRSVATYSISAQVTDAWHLSSQLGASFTVFAAPSVAAFSASVTTVDLGGSTTLTVEPQGGSGVYTIAYTALPTGCSSANKTSLVCTPTATGTYNVSVTVTDSFGLSATSTTLVTVENPPAAANFFTTTTGLLAIGLVVVVVIAVVAVALLMRRRRTPKSPEAWEEPAPETGTP